MSAPGRLPSLPLPSRRFRLGCSLLLLLAGCGGPGPRVADPEPQTITQAPPPRLSSKGEEVAIYALGLIDTGYRFGGKNPEAGLDCSGMVSYIYAQATGLRLKGSAADLARRGRAVEKPQLRPGDLVFFNTQQRAFSHVGIYLGEQRFIHAPSRNGRVRIDRLDQSYYAQRYEAARTYFD